MVTCQYVRRPYASVKLAVVGKMPPKLRMRPAMKDLKSEQTIGKCVQPACSSGNPFSGALTGSNMQINIRLGSNRVAADTFNRTMIAAKSDDCLHTSILRENTAGTTSASVNNRKIHTDRPLTAGYNLSRKSPYSAGQQPRSVTQFLVRKKPTQNQSEPRGRNKSCHSPSLQSSDVNSSLDSELATVGSVDFESSYEEKRSFVVFSSSSSEMGRLINDSPARLPERDSLVTQGASNASHGRTAHFHDTCTSNDSKDSISVTNDKVNGTSKTFAMKVNCDKEEDKQAGNQCKQQKILKSEPKQASCSKENDEREQDSPTISEEIDSYSQENRSKANVFSAQSIDKGSDNQKRVHHARLHGGEPNVLSEILTFLDDANKVTGSPVGANSETESSAGFCKPSAENISKLHGMSISQLTEEVLSLQMLLQDKDAKLVAMERALDHQRELLSRSTKTAQRELNWRFKCQKEEYETTLKRHVSFIQQLVDEKKVLAEKCESLAAEMRQQANKHETERRLHDERHSTEIRRLKQALTKDQRHQQEKWVIDRTQHIREVTARGLEPELRRLMAQHQIELQSLRAIHQDELIRVEQSQMNKASQQLNALRERMESEREEACAKEREVMRMKFDRQLDDMENIHAAKHQRIQTELERERKRWLEEESRNKEQQDEVLERHKEKWQREKVAGQKLLKAEIETLKQQHQEQLIALRKSWEDVKSEEITALRQSLEMKANERERQLNEIRRKEREEDAQNHARHLTEELQRQHEDWKRLSEQQLERIREKHTDEIGRLDQAESELRDKLMEIRRSLTDKDEELASLRIALFQHSKENQDMKKILEQYTGERNDLRGALQKELKAEFQRLEDERAQLQEELSKTKSEHRMEIARLNSQISNMNNSHDKMLADIHEKVKQAVSKKDEALTQLQQKLHAAISRCQHLEDLIDRQHIDLLARK